MQTRNTAEILPRELLEIQRCSIIMGGMLSKQRIEQQLEHFKNGCANAGSRDNEIWVEALEWVLGDEEHRKAYAAVIGQLELVAQGRFDADSTARERIMALALSQALERLR